MVKPKSKSAKSKKTQKQNKKGKNSEKKESQKGKTWGKKWTSPFFYHFVPF
jgi:hypothetical protein